MCDYVKVIACTMAHHISMNTGSEFEDGPFIGVDAPQIYGSGAERNVMGGLATAFSPEQDWPVELRASAHAPQRHCEMLRM